MLLPPGDELDAVLGTQKWLVRQAQSEALGLNAATQVEILPAVSVSGRYGPQELEW